MCLGFVYDVYVPQSDEVALSAKIGITKTTATLSRLTCSLNFMAHVTAQTRQMLNVGDDNAIIHSEATAARIKTQMDNSVQSNIVKIQGIHTP